MDEELNYYYQLLLPVIPLCQVLCQALPTYILSYPPKNLLGQVL